MIPPLTASGALPPFIGTDSTQRAQCSPYQAEMSHVRLAFAHTPAREVLLTGLLDYRTALRSIGITTGHQLIDGSFTEDCELTRGRPPGDIDLVTFATLPVLAHDRQAFVMANIDLFDPTKTKAQFGCDAYFVDLDIPPQLLVADTMYWHGLFSHQRVTSLWKGLIQVPLASDDDDVRRLIAVSASW